MINDAHRIQFYCKSALKMCRNTYCKSPLLLFLFLSHFMKSLLLDCLLHSYAASVLEHILENQLTPNWYRTYRWFLLEHNAETCRSCESDTNYQYNADVCMHDGFKLILSFIIYLICLLICLHPSKPLSYTVPLWNKDRPASITKMNGWKWSSMDNFLYLHANVFLLYV